MRRNTPRNQSSRRAAATIEFAVCLPIIVLIVFGGIQASSMLFLKQTLVQAAFESVKTAVKVDGSAARAEATARAVTDGRNLQGVSVTVNPNNIENTPRGSIIEVTVTAPGDNNSLFPFSPFAGKNVTATAVMVKE